MMMIRLYRIRADNATLYYKMIAAHNYFLKGAVITIVTLLFILRYLSINHQPLLNSNSS